MVPVDQIEAEISPRLPDIPGLLEGCCAVLAGMAPTKTAATVLLRGSQQGHTIGICPPCIAERSRICGIDEWVHELGPTPNQLHSAQGNFFDPAAIKMRLHASVVPFLQGDIDLPRHPWVHPSTFPQTFQHLLEIVISNGFGRRAVSSPFPVDLRNFPDHCDKIVNA